MSLLLILFNNCSLSSDGEKENPEKDDFTYELPWSGETEKFTISADKGIHLNDPSETAGSAYLTTPSTQVRNSRWEFGVRLSFNPSSNSYARFYLTSSSNVLSENVEGYFIQIGGVKDNVALYRQQGSEPQLLASGRELMKGNNAPKIFVKVECDNNGYWTFWTRLESESEYTKEKQVKETQINSSAYCGIYCVYTKSRCDGFTFHHVRLSNDVENATPPEETPDEPENPNTPDTPTLPENVKGMLLFNEVMYNNAKDGAEYIELYNPSTQTLTISELYLYKMYDNGRIFNTTVLHHEGSELPLTIPAKSYLCFTKNVSLLMKKHKVDGKYILAISNFPALSNSGGYLAISSSEKTEQGHTFDTCYFKDSMHKNKKTSTIGVSLEKKSPELLSGNANWHSSTNATGGTPGIKNSEVDATF